MKDHYYIHEISNKPKIKFFLVTLILIIILTGATIAVIATFDTLLTIPQVTSIKSAIYDEITSLSPAGLFYSGFFGGLFFLPIPQELFFYYSLTKGHPILIAFLTINAGYLLAQAVNYFIGVKLNKPFMNLVSKKRLYKSRRFLNKHGAKAIFIFNFLPLPAPLLTFALGITRYNIYRMFFYTTLGTICKYLTIIALFFLTTKI